MCLICVELQRDKLTSKEARRNLGESYKTLEEEHRLEVLKLIWKKEDEENVESTAPPEEGEWRWDFSESTD